MGGIAPLSFINSLPLAGLGKDLGFYLTYSHCYDIDSQTDEVSIGQSQIEKSKNGKSQLVPPES
jgi:hypothetical protein